MRLKYLISCFFVGALVTSCIKDEAPNSEADILTCAIEGNILNREPVVGNDEILLYIKDGAAINNVIPKFTLTDGATIHPAQGTACDFTQSQAQLFTVTSQDGKWSKEYTLKVLPPINTDYSFENIKADSREKYQIFFERYNDNGNEIFSWASGNEGFAFTGVKANPNEYPTAQSDNGHEGKCLKLETKSTGDSGASVEMPLAAGNLFLGSFTVNLADVLSATKFGVPFMHIPTTMNVWYKYKPGETFYVAEGQKLVEVPGRKDLCDIYAVFYEVTSEQETLNGHNILDESNPNIISIAHDLSKTGATDTWTEFNLEFKQLPGRKIEETKLKEGKYNLAIVFSSSIRGDHFEGALGSTLWIDEVSIDYVGKAKK